MANYAIGGVGALLAFSCGLAGARLACGVPSEEGVPLSQEMQEHCTERGLRPDVRVMSGSVDRLVGKIWMDCGLVEICWPFPPAITVPPALLGEGADIGIQSFFIKRRLMHLAGANSFIETECTSMSLIPGTVLSFLFPYGGPACLGVGLCTSATISRGLRARSDLRALDHMTVEELKSGIIYYMARREAGRLKQDPSGYVGCAMALECCAQCILTHSSDRAQIQTLAAVLRQRNVILQNVPGVVPPVEEQIPVQAENFDVDEEPVQERIYLLASRIAREPEESVACENWGKRFCFLGCGWC